MIKKFSFLSFCIVLILLTACMQNSAIVMPFEATFHKYVYMLTKDFAEINTSTEEKEEYCKLIENEEFAILLKDGTLAFYNKTTKKYYDTFGNESNEMPQTGLNISVKDNKGFELKYFSKNAKDRKSAADCISEQIQNYTANDNALWKDMLSNAGIN